MDITARHSVRDDAVDRWVHAAELQVGHRLRTLDGKVATVTAVRNHVGAQTMRDLTVDTDHTYYVVAGNTPVLVHNEGGDNYNQARNKALAWLEERGFVAERTTYGKFGTIAGQPVGMQTADGKTGFRIEFDERNGAHINVWSGKGKGRNLNLVSLSRPSLKSKVNSGAKGDW